MSERATEALENLVRRLEAVTQAVEGEPRDAIDDILDGPGRQSAVTDVRHDPVVEQFRREMTDGLIRADTAGRLLGLITSVVARLL